MSEARKYANNTPIKFQRQTIRLPSPEVVHM